jgi:hypothetical protein
MRVRRKTIALLGTLTIVAVLCVALASIALARVDRGGTGASAGYVDLASGSQVVWGSDAWGGRGAKGAETTPTISGVSPSIKAIGSATFNMTVSGGSIVTSTTATWGGTALTTVGTPTGGSMVVTVLAARVATAGTVAVRLVTGSKVSTETATFTVTQPTITSVSPTFVASTATAATITLTGTHLKDGLDSPHLALKGTGAILGTTINATTASAAVDTTMVGVFSLPTPTVAPAGIYDVVLTYGATGSVTKAAAFSINYPVPTVTTISPTTVYAGSGEPLVLTVNGTGFVPAPALPGAVGSAIKIGARLTTDTTFVSATQLTVPLTPADIVAAATVPITVVNPAPGGGTSNAVDLTVASDTTAPVTTISGADSAWHTEDVVLTVAASDAQSGVQKTQYALNTTSPAVLVGSTITVPADGSFDGVNTVEAWSTDWCGNVEDPGAVVTVKIDTVGPKTYSYPPATVKAGKKARATFGYRVNDVTPKASVTLKIKKKSNGKTVRSYALGNKSTGVRLKYRVKPKLAKGTYVLYVYATDQAGLKQSRLGYKTFKVK